MITNRNLITILKKSTTVKDQYDKQMDTLASQNKGVYQLDENTQRELANVAFNTVCKESTINVSWGECCAIFDLMERGN